MAALLSLLRVLLLGVLLPGDLPLAAGYNVDLDGWVVYRGPEHSMFGFSVAGYTDRNDTWVMVGAPKADTSQPGVVQGGAVFKCSAQPPTDDSSRHRTCQLVPFDETGNNEISGQQMVDKSGQWFGAHVATSPGVNNSGVVVACAPRYLWYTSNLKRRDPVGTCFVAKNGLTEIAEYSPCRYAGSWGYHRQGFCQAGFSSSINKDGDRLFIGAVGSWYWQGRLFMQHLYSRSDEAGTTEAPSTEDDSYLGYSVAVGEFTGDDDQDVAVGMPRGNNLTGKVLMFTSSLRSLHTLRGHQIGAYFGYSLCVADLDGDGLDDVIVGAPFHTDYDVTDGKYETGQVVVAYQSADHNFTRFQYLNGRDSRSRFGLAVTSLGDIDLDGYDDLAVGAPHDGNGDQGAVYIFHGTRKGINPKPTQVIVASSLEPRLRSFGHSVHGGRDLDGNQYPDLVVGAHDSSAALYFRSRPVVHVQASVQYRTGGTKLIDLTDPAAQCLLDDGRQVPCVSVMFCMTYDGVEVDKRAEFEVEFRLDALRPKTPRLFFRDHVGRSRLNVTARADRGEEWCHERFVYIEDSIRDKLTPLVTEAHYSLVYRKPANQRGPLQPVLNLDRAPVASDSVSIQKDCGGDDVCVPDLQLVVTSSHDVYLLGSSDSLTLYITVFNNNEDAFEAMFYISLPIGVDFVGTEQSNSSTSSSFQVLCSDQHESEDKDEAEELSCDLGNPLTTKSQVEFLIHLMPRSTSEEMQRDYRFSMKVNSTNPESRHTRTDNDVTLTLPIGISTELLVFGISQPEAVHYNISRYSAKKKIHEQDIGPELYHVYEITNAGPSEIVAAEAYVLWPTYTLPEDNHLLYLLDPPSVEGPGSCDPVPGLNPLQLKLFERSQRPSAPLMAPSLLRTRRSSESEFQGALGCGPTTCTKIFCRIGPLQDKQNVIIRIRTRLWVDTIEEERRGNVRGITISSRLVARVTGLPHQVDPSYMNHTSFTVTTSVHSEELDTAPVPWWVIVLASCGGVLILVILVLILYKLGFFKRHRRPGSAGGADGGGGGGGGGAGRAAGNGNTSPSYHAYQKVPYNPAADERL